MTEREKIMKEFVGEMILTDSDTYEEIKWMILSHFIENVKLLRYFGELFRMIEDHRPKLIEMKESALS